MAGFQIFDFTALYIAEEAKIPSENLLQPKTKEKYEKAYEEFIKWKTVKKANSFSENVFLAYFSELAQEKRPTTLWCVYSMLKLTVRLKQNVNIGDYLNLTSFLKRKSDGFMPKKSNVLTANNINTFIKEAPDEQYLFEKVVLIFGVNGACRRNELTNLKTSDVETHNNKMIVQLRCKKTKNSRMFIVQDELLKVVQKYEKLRPGDITTDRFFINYQNQKCTKQPVGINKIAAVPKRIATYLDLPDPESYTGHCFRRSSGAFFGDSGANFTRITTQTDEAILKTSSYGLRSSTSFTSPNELTSDASSSTC